MTQKITMDDNMVDDFFVLYNVMMLISSRVAAARIFEMTEPWLKSNRFQDLILEHVHKASLAAVSFLWFPICMSQCVCVTGPIKCVPIERIVRWSCFQPCQPWLLQAVSGIYESKNRKWKTELNDEASRTWTAPRQNKAVCCVGTLHTIVKFQFQWSACWFVEGRIRDYVM